MKVALFLHRFIRRLLLISALFPVMAAYAVPVSNHGYIAELLVSGVGAADGMTVDADGALFITDYQAGRILKVEDAGRKGSHSYTVFADGILFPTDIALGTDGNLYATSSTGGSNSIQRFAPDGTRTVFAVGFSYPTSIASFSNDLFVSNSGDGTISKVISDGTITTHATGFSAPGGPYGISTNTSGTLYTVDHRTGQVFSVGSDGLLTPIGAVSPSGGVFTAFDSYLGLLVSDVIQGIIYEFDLTGNRSVFASGFTGKNTPPVIGPAGLIFDTVGNLYVGDGDSVWRFSFVPEPTTLALMGLGLAGIGYRRHRSKIAV